MSVVAWSLLVYGAMFVVWLAVELSGLSRRKGLPVPWFTESETIWWLERKLPFLRVVVFAVFVDLAFHLGFGTPLWPDF